MSFKAFVSWKILGKFSCPSILKTDKMGEGKYVPHMHYFFIHLFFLLLLGGDKNRMDKYCAELECLEKIVWTRGAGLKIGEVIVFFLMQILCTIPSLCPIP